MSVTTFVLVHGASCTSAVWAPVARELALLGHRTVAVDLPGHGLGATVPLTPTAPSGMAGIGTADDVALVVDAVRRAAEHGPVVLVGTSRGGLTVTAVGNAVPELLDRLVYVSAWCCVDRTHVEYAAGPENATSELAASAALLLANPAEIGGIRLDWRTTDPAQLDVLQSALLADGTREELLAYLHTMDADESLNIDDQATRVDPAAWGRIPHTYVRLTEDHALPLPLQDRFIAEADTATPHNPFDVHSITSSHIGFQVHPTEIVRILDDLVVKR